jgi:hypothetical protein
MRITAENDLLDAALQNPEIAPFAMFELDLVEARDPQTGELLFPELESKHTSLWHIRSNTANGGEVATHKDARAQRVQDYANRVARGEGVFESPDVMVADDPQDEGDGWDHFWCGASPTQSGVVPRSPFEGGRVPVRVDDPIEIAEPLYRCG